MTLRTTLKIAWNEHGAWAILLTAFGLGVLVALPPTWISLSTLLGLSGFAVTKTLAVRVWRSDEGWLHLLLWTAFSGCALLPLLLAAPYFVFGVGAIGLPFLALFAWEALAPRGTRTLPVEFFGTLLLSSSAGLALLAAQPHGYWDALLVSGAAAALFLPGMPRARMLKEGGWGLRVALLLLALLGAAALCAYAYFGVVAAWGAIAALIFVGDLRAFLLAPKVTAKHLGLALTLRAAPAALVLSFAWRTVGG